MDFILIEDHNLVRQGVSKIIEEKVHFIVQKLLKVLMKLKYF